MIAICLVRQKTSLRYEFDYIVPSTLSPSLLSLVEVPFLNKKVPAIVVGFKDDSKFAKKEIIRLLSTGAIFTGEQLKLAKEIAFEFLSDPSQAIFSFLPNLNKKDIVKIPAPAKSQLSKKAQTFFIESNLSNRLQFFIQSIDSTKQNLMIFSELEQIEKVKTSITKLNPSLEIHVWHSGLSSSQKTSVWSKIISGEKCLVLSTRHGLFLPFRNLENIYLDSPCDFGYYEDQEPRYNAYRASRIVSKLYRVNLYLADSSPTAEIFALIKNKRLEKIEVKNEIKVIKLPNLNAVFASEEFQSAFKRARKVLVSGYFKNITRLSCEDCKNEISCKGCGKSVFDQNTGKCVSCKLSGVMTCPSCRGVKIKQSFFSIANISKALEKHLDCAVSENENSSAKVIIKPLGELNGLMPIFDLAIFPYFEYTSGLPFLSSQTRLVRIIRELPSLGIKQLFISTNKSVELAYLLENNKFDQILDSELKVRNQESMPPFTRYLEISTSQIPKELEEYNEEMIKADGKSFGFLKHSQIKKLQNYFAKNHPDLKCRLDSPDYC